MKEFLVFCSSLGLVTIAIFGGFIVYKMRCWYKSFAREWQINNLYSSIRETDVNVERLKIDQHALKKELTELAVEAHKLRREAAESRHAMQLQIEKLRQDNTEKQFALLSVLENIKGKKNGTSKIRTR